MTLAIQIINLCEKILYRYSIPYGMPYHGAWGRYGGYYNYGIYNYGKAKKEDDFIKQYTKYLIEYAAMVGVDEDTILNHQVCFQV